MASAVQVRHVRKTHRRSSETVVALDDVSFDLEPGAVVALTGPSGSGKSTLLNVIAGFDRPESGQVLIGDFDVTAAKPSAMDVMRTRTVGFVFQQFHLVPGLTALENVELALLTGPLPTRARRERAMTLLEQLGVGPCAHRRPAKMSGGQQQRVAIARALAGQPRVVLADEPTAALDQAAAESLLERFGELAKSHGVAALIASHDARVLQRADHVLTLGNGRLRS